MEPWHENPTDWSLRYHVPRSQVHEGSRGGHAGHVHLHLPIEPRVPSSFTVVGGRRTITRLPSRSLCGRPVPWYDRPPLAGETVCERCRTLAPRYGIPWPNNDRAERRGDSQ